VGSYINLSTTYKQDASVLAHEILEPKYHCVGRKMLYGMDFKSGSNYGNSGQR
jgi:hypothetical protein